MEFSADDEDFRGRVREWLAANVPPALRGAGGPGRDDEAFADRLAWGQRLAAAGWNCLGWPAEHGGLGASLARQVIFHEEYARSRAPARVAVVGEELLAPTLIAFGTPEQKRRFLPPIAAVRELWCQGYSEPGAGSDLASVATTAVRDGDEWVVTGQKVWTSLAQYADWCFAVCRTTPGSRRSAGLSYLLVPMRQPGVTVRPIRQLTGEAEFNEVFFDGARTPAGNIVGAPGEGWRIAMATLRFERGVAMLGRQVGYRRELADLVAVARRSGAAADPGVRERLARAWIGLEVMRAYAVDTLGEAGGSGAQASVLKTLWSRWHQELGELAMDVHGAASMTAGTWPAGTWPADTGPGDSAEELRAWQKLYLFSRAETIYGGSDEIQHNIIATHALGLPRPPRR